jgi:hypothetical protein
LRENAYFSLEGNFLQVFQAHVPEKPHEISYIMGQPQKFHQSVHTSRRYIRNFPRNFTGFVERKVAARKKTSTHQQHQQPVPPLAGPGGFTSKSNSSNNSSKACSHDNRWGPQGSLCPPLIRATNLMEAWIASEWKRYNTSAAD